MRADARALEQALLRPADGVFDDTEVAHLPIPVARYFRTAVAGGTPLAVSARIHMRGSIRIGRWIPFTAREVLTPQEGFVWAARAAGVISGSDSFVDGEGRMDWRLLGLKRVMHASGPDISRSAAGRAAAEAVWVPTSLLPRFGVEWTANAEDQITARYRIADHEIELHLTIAADGHVRSARFERWGDPDDTGTFGWCSFGGQFTEHATFDGVTIPSEGRIGWHYDTDRWDEGEFFRYRITGLELVKP